MGVDINRVITVTFLIGGLLGGVGGLLFGWSFGVTRFAIGFTQGIKAFTAAVLGGIGNIRGAAVGGLLLGIFENVVGRVLRNPVAGRCGVRDPGAGPDVQAHRHPGREDPCREAGPSPS